PAPDPRAQHHHSHLARPATDWRSWARPAAAFSPSPAQSMLPVLSGFDALLLAGPHAGRLRSPPPPTPALPGHSRPVSAHTACDPAPAPEWRFPAKAPDMTPTAPRTARRRYVPAPPSTHAASS